MIHPNVCRMIHRVPAICAYRQFEQLLFIPKTYSIQYVSSFSTFSKKSVILNDDDIEEKFVRGSGPGGQHVNKTNNKVQLKHLPTGITVQCHDQRDLHRNRKIARKKLLNRLDMELNGNMSRVGQRIERIKKRKLKSKQRSRRKHGIEKNIDDNNEVILTPRPIPDTSVEWTSSYNKK